MCEIAKRVLAEAGDSEEFWKLSEAERLIWMIRRAGQLGKLSVTRKRRRRPGRPTTQHRPRKL
jgi:hypothetical protein